MVVIVCPLAGTEVEPSSVTVAPGAGAAGVAYANAWVVLGAGTAKTAAPTSSMPAPQVLVVQ